MSSKKRQVRPRHGLMLYAPFDVPDEQATLEFLAAQGPPSGGVPGTRANGGLQPDWMVIAEIVCRIDQTQYAWPVGRMLAVRPGPTFNDASARYQDVIQPYEATIQRVADLLVRLDSRHTEIAASVHFAAGVLASELRRRPSQREVLERVRHWKQRRRPPLEERDIVMAIRDLAALGWIEVTRSADPPPGDQMVTVA